MSDHDDQVEYPEFKMMDYDTLNEMLDTDSTQLEPVDLFYESDDWLTSLVTEHADELAKMEDMALTLESEPAPSEYDGPVGSPPSDHVPDDPYESDFTPEN